MTDRLLLLTVIRQQAYCALLGGIGIAIPNPIGAPGSGVGWVGGVSMGEADVLDAGGPGEKVGWVGGVKIGPPGVVLPIVVVSVGGVGGVMVVVSGSTVGSVGGVMVVVSGSTVGTLGGNRVVVSGSGVDGATVVVISGTIV
uniref:Uncharacterized protein n=1 Tax=Anopheles coluzzii TaxID=1518534 RepID=A0A8W7P9U3_ANOCL